MHVLGGVDGPHAVGELAVAPRVAEAQHHRARLLPGLLADLLGQIAVKQGGDLGPGLGQEGEGEHHQPGGVGEQAAPHPLDGAGHGLLEQLVLGAQLAVGPDHHLHMAAGGVLHVLLELQQGDVPGVVLALDVGHLHHIVAQGGVAVLPLPVDGRRLRLPRAV